MKKVLTIIISFFILIYSCNAIQINASSAIMYNLQDDSIIFEKNADEQMQVASLTKIVTAITILENNPDLSKKILVKEEMLKDLKLYSRYGFKKGDIVSIKDLLYALLLSSSADAANILAIGTTGSIKNFSILMNNELIKIGVHNSHFDNPIGKDSVNNYSTAKDMAQILKYALKNKEFKTIFETKNYKSNDLKKDILSTLYLYDYDTAFIKGAKTGYTENAGRCLASNAIIDGIPYLIIVLNDPVEEGYNVKDSIDLYNYYSKNYKYVNVIKNKQEVAKIKIRDGKNKEYVIRANDDINMYLPNSYVDDLVYKYDGKMVVDRTIPHNSKLGEIKVLHGSDVIYTEDVYLDQTVEYSNQKAEMSILIFTALTFGFFDILLIIRKHYE